MENLLSWLLIQSVFFLKYCMQFYILQLDALS